MDDKKKGKEANVFGKNWQLWDKIRQRTIDLGD